jgi:ABC-2 type transport system permease protein
VRLLGHQLRGEQQLFWRSRELAFFTFLLPILFFVLLGSVYGKDHITADGATYKGSHYLLAGMLGYGVAATAFAGLAITLVIRRESGVLKRLRATPLPAWAYVGGVLGSTLFVFGLEAVVLVALGRGLFGVPVPDHLFSLAVTLLVGAVAFASLGLALTAAVKSAEGSSAVVNAIYLPMTFISGSFFSPHSFPQFLRAIGDVLPLTYFIKLVRDVMLRGHEFWTHPSSIAVVAGWGAAGALIALRSFRWEPTES